MKRFLFILISVMLSVVGALAQIIVTIAGTGTAGYSGDGGQATNAELYHPRDVCFDASGNMYIVDFINVNVRKVNTAGIISTIAGSGTNGYSGDGGQATAAELHEPTGVAVDTHGNIYIADYENQRIRMVNIAGIISTFAGTGTAGYSGDGGQASNAELCEPDGLIFDIAGNLYISDECNNRIRMVNTTGIISTVAGDGPQGSGSFGGDGGQATAAELNNPTGVVFDAVGNMYITDAVNNRIRKVNTAGIMTTIAGNGTSGYSGDGGQATAAELNTPYKTVVDATGNIYIADFNNSVIRMVNTSGIISTIAGNGTRGYSGDCGQATAAELYAPDAIAFDNLGNLYIADENNSRIREVSSQTCTAMGIEQVKENNSNLLAYPNPFAAGVTIKYYVPEGTTNAQVIFYDEFGNQLKTFAVTETGAGQLNITSANLAPGTYSYSLLVNGKVIDTKKMIKTN
jgi:sugar lactone lactonase YvrE